MTAAFPSFSERRSADAMARRLAEDAARTLREDAQRAIDETVRGLAKLRECGVSKNWLDDMLATLSDEVSNLNVAIERGLGGADPFSKGLDVSEINALLIKVRS